MRPLIFRIRSILTQVPFNNPTLRVYLYEYLFEQGID